MEQRTYRGLFLWISPCFVLGMIFSVHPIKQVWQRRAPEIRKVYNKRIWYTPPLGCVVPSDPVEIEKRAQEAQKNRAIGNRLWRRDLWNAALGRKVEGAPPY